MTTERDPDGKTVRCPLQTLQIGKVQHKKKKRPLLGLGFPGGKGPACQRGRLGLDP